jgi:putative protease
LVILRRSSVGGLEVSLEKTPPELLAPAGNWDCARAAVANGADAIYFGLDCGFNARARAANFAVDDLPDLMSFLHRHGVRGYVTLNTLAFSDELESLENLIRCIAEAGADALLVQDLGLVRLIRSVAPDLPIHASTQMTLTSAECIAVAAELGVERVVVARELSVREIAKIHKHSTMPLEVFVHGALCVAYSGQCLTSESLGGRSANRGQCAQACRLPFELICDDRDIDLGDQKYLLSPQDLAAYALVPELIDAGVVAFKIEGRLKTPEYVANITRHYRQAIDSAMAGKPVEFSPRDVEEMELSFSRGFSVGWLHGCDHKALVPATSSSKRGVLVGEVRDVRGSRVSVNLRGRLKAGDGVVFEGDRAANEEQGGRVFAIFQRGERIRDEVAAGTVDLTFSSDAVDCAGSGQGRRFGRPTIPN